MSDSPNISRRDLLRGRFIGSLLRHAAESIGLETDEHDAPLDDHPKDPSPSNASSSSSPAATRYPHAFPVLRPPGAIEEGAFLDGCTKCDACVEACPHEAIVHAPLRFRHAAGTPMIDPSPQGKPCYMCDDFPCIAACEPGVLRFDAPKRMGTAGIDIFTCLAHQKSFCTVCSEQCPVPGAIEIINGKPRIVESTCTGCGVCQHVCPAPANAILLMPIAQRPSAPPNNSHASGSNA